MPDLLYYLSAVMGLLFALRAFTWGFRNTALLFVLLTAVDLSGTGLVSTFIGVS
jgi:hypothetical protein